MKDILTDVETWPRAPVDDEERKPCFFTCESSEQVARPMTTSNFDP